MSFSGCLTALVTPFDQTGEGVDFESLDRLIDFQIECGVNGLVVCGSTGEAATLSSHEYAEVIRHVSARVRGKLPCLAGISQSSTARAVELANLLSQWGCDGALVSAPPYNRPSQAGLREHFRAVHRAARLPLVAYNIPGRTGVNVLPETLAGLAGEGVIQAVKEASGSMDQMLDLLAATKGRVAVLSGEDSLVAALMSCGGAGVISACANVIPREFVEITARALRGDYARAGELQLAILPLVRALFSETNPVPVKAALKLKGVIASAAVRLPLVAASEQTRERLERAFEELRQ